MNNQRIALTTDLLCFRLMGIYDETLHFFEAGYYSGTNTDLKHVLAVRLHDCHGTSLGCYEIHGTDDRMNGNK
ncbi:hypothetical protein ACFL27_20515 [candidate division CSSED10-310 bacterium]|uniref:Uncharacterized protein n=1 Tax=candidate division CSSED10-310 bacterium TaxID=2855610 RepID=A0ABV6Z2E7_UNCC1